MLYNKAENSCGDFFLGQLSVISAGFHIPADSSEKTEIIESTLDEQTDQSGCFH